MDPTVLVIAISLIIVIVVSGLTAAIGYFWASSEAKSTLLKRVQEQSDEATRKAQAQLQLWKDQELEQIRQHMLLGLKGEAIKDAQDQLVKWRSEELENAKIQIRDVLAKESTLNFEKWKTETEAQIRQDAIDKSRSVTTGKMTEHLVPYLPGFGFDPRDARFIGSPIDLVVFDGLGAGEVQKIVFVEIKTGGSTLSTRERIVRDAVVARKVEWQEIRANLNVPENPEQLAVIETVLPLSPEEKARQVRARSYQRLVKRMK
jgi:predicted Holliday junction resolvase-like endonuclease